MVQTAVLAPFLIALARTALAAPTALADTSAVSANYKIKVPCGCHNDCTVKAQFDTQNPGNDFCTKQCGMFKNAKEGCNEERDC